jgi:hypothetical protein
MWKEMKVKQGVQSVYSRDETTENYEEFVLKTGRKQPFPLYETEFPIHNRDTMIYIAASSVSLLLFQILGSFRQSFNRLRLTA